MTPSISSRCVPHAEFSCDVSIIMAAYNSEATIRQAIDSVLSQEQVRFELLVGDDASSDGTVSIVQSFNDSRIQLFRRAVNAGPGATRDMLISKAQGRWLAFMDADDAMTNGRLARLAQVASSLPDCLLFDDIVECHDTAAGLAPWRRVHGANAFNASGISANRIGLDAMILHKRLLIKPFVSAAEVKRTRATHPSFRYGEDGSFFWTLIARGTPAYYLPEAMYLYRICPGSASSKPGRYENLLHCLDALRLESLSSSEIAALDERIRTTTRQRSIASIRDLPMSRRWCAYTGHALHDWRNVPRLIRMLFNRIAYESSRLLAGGKRR